MADFNFPDFWYRDRSSGPNDLGFSTILGSASSLSPRWNYLRTRPWPEDDSYTGGRGIAPSVEPPPGSPEYREAKAGLAALQAVAPQTKTATAATTLAAAGESAWSSGPLAPVAARLAPLAVAAAPAVGLAAPLIALPKIVPGDETIPLGDDLRARRPIGQRSVILEQRVKDGLLGTSIGAKWQELPPVDATFGDGLPGRRPVFVDADQLRGAVGAEAADRLLATGGVIDRRSAANGDETANRVQTALGSGNELPPPPISLPSKIEMRIGVSTDQGATTVPREATREEILQVCPNFGEYERYAMDAAAKYKAAGLPNGMEYGRLVHRDVELKLKDIQSRLDERDVRQLRPELAIRQGISPSYSRGSSRIDVVELHRDHVTVCVYEIKTGRAPIPREVMLRYVREAGVYADATGLGYKHVYFIPIHVP
jgi:hypothetical protein